jgi:hypothetical protein
MTPGNFKEVIKAASMLVDEIDMILHPDTPPKPTAKEIEILLRGKTNILNRRKGEPTAANQMALHKLVTTQGTELAAVFVRLMAQAQKESDERKAKEPLIPVSISAAKK